MDLITLFGLLFVTGGATLLGSVPVLFHKYLKDKEWTWLESFGGGVMTGASFFSLLIPAYGMLRYSSQSYWTLVIAVTSGILFIFFTAALMGKITKNVLHQRAFLFVFAMGLHNVPEGLAVGADVAGLGWRESLPLSIAIFVQNLPEGLVSAMIFLVGGFTVSKAMVANGITAIIEAVSSLVGFLFVTYSQVSLPFMLSFAGACMLSVVAREALVKARGVEAANYSWSGFIAGLLICVVLDLAL